MAASQPYTVACDGGLVKSANSIDLLRTPGVARELRNFEVSTEVDIDVSMGLLSMEEVVQYSLQEVQQLSLVCFHMRMELS